MASIAWPKVIPPMATTPGGAFPEILPPETWCLDSPVKAANNLVEAGLRPVPSRCRKAGHNRRPRETRRFGEAGVPAARVISGQVPRRVLLDDDGISGLMVDLAPLALLSPAGSLFEESVRQSQIDQSVRPGGTFEQEPCQRGFCVQRCNHVMLLPT